MPTPGDLLNRRFEKASFGGYKTSDVDSFMVDSASVVSSLNRENAELKRKVEAAEKKLVSYQDEEESLKSTLLSAQRLADKIVNDAQSKADLMLRDAQNKADLTITDAQIKADNLTEKANREIELRHSEAELIKHEVSEFKLKVMRMYRTHLELINALPSESDTPIAETEDVSVSADETPEPKAETEDVSVSADETPEPKAETQQENVVEEAPLPLFESNIAVQPLDEWWEASAPLPLEPKEETVQTSQDKVVKEPETEDKAEILVENETKDQVAATVMLNLRYNQKTGEYEPIDAPKSFDLSDFSAEQNEKGSIKFGAAYDISTDSFKDGTSRHGSKKR